MDTLFDMTPKGSAFAVKNQRHEAKQKLYDKQNNAFKVEFEKFLINFAKNNDEFIAEKCQMAYDKTDLPKPTDKRASGQVYTKLISKGILVKTGRFEVSQVRKSPMMVYRFGE